MITVSAPAKINWYLSVRGTRSDGYHELDTAFQTISLADTVTLEPAKHGIVVESNVDLPPRGANLAYRAAQCYLSEARLDAGVAINVTKRIPMQGGLGGGSSDAAAVLKGMLDLYGVLTPANIFHLAAHLGSDVTFFLRGGTARGKGRGEELSPLYWPHNTPLLLITPSFGLSTPEVFRAADELEAASSVDIPAVLGAIAAGELRALCDVRNNDLWKAALRLRPELLSMARQVERVCQGVGFSGSGSTMFAPFPGEEGVCELAARLPDCGLISVCTQQAGDKHRGV
jgi:4-diphosphocytidyl-2-C-methyl-D-erythritol kinase